MVTLMNVVHCKCPRYGDHFHEVENPQDLFWNSCGVQTLRILSSLKPKVVVCLGGAVQYWAQYIHNTQNPVAYAPWFLQGALEGNWYGRLFHLVNLNTGVRIPLVMSYHPSQGGGRFEPLVPRIAELLRQILFRP
jgi:uracil-DNA glycosylase